MHNLEEHKKYESLVTKICYLTNITFLFAHIVYLIFFLIVKLDILVYVNIGSISIYLLLFILIRCKKELVYAIACGFEIFAYMIIATVLCGFSSGFQLCLAGLCILSFFTAYFSRGTRNLKGSILWCVLMLIGYVCLIFYCRFNKAYYELEAWTTVTLATFHAIIVFAFIGTYLYVFTRYAINLENKIIKESRTDRLTNIPNRYALYDYYDSLSISDEYFLAIFDIDNFKKINDIYGHVCGDYILKEISKIANDHFSTDFISRYGGEEFVVIVKSDNYEAALEKIDKIRQKIFEHAFIFDDKTISCSITIGVSKYDKEYSIDEWIMHSDNKLYEGKNKGKNITIS